MKFKDGQLAYLNPNILKSELVRFRVSCLISVSAFSLTHTALASHKGRRREEGEREGR